MIKLSNISKNYNGVKVLKDININFRENELVSILGPSGSGKSTLLNIISAVEKPDEGSLFLGETNIFSLSLKKQDHYRGNYINYIFQNYNLISYLTVKENLKISSNIKNNTFKKENINLVLKRLGIKSLLNKKVNSLSGGEQQRVAIARSQIGDVKIILADEPTGALDSKNSIKVMKLLKQISKKKLVIVVTHNEKLAREYSDRIIKLNDGKVINDSKLFKKEVNKKYPFRKTKLSLFNILNISFKNINTKKIRTYLTTLAFSIGLISLTLVLAISAGFKKEIKAFEEESLFNYPLIISKERLDLQSAFVSDKNNYKEGFINIDNKSSMLVTNDINNELLDKIRFLDNSLITGISFYKNINSEYKDYLYVNPTNDYFDLLSGFYPKNNNEVLLLLDHNKSISKSLSNILNIKEQKYEDVINKKIEINNKMFFISGVVISNNNYFTDLFGILYNDNAFDEEILEIFIYPKDYKSKIIIKGELNSYNVIDDSFTIINMTKRFISGISYILVAFSIISLIVSIIMISIITYISVLERFREIGILKSIGATSNDIKKLFLSENIIIALFSFIITIEFSNVISNIINKYVNSKIGISSIVLINNKILFLILLLSISLTLIAGLIPAGIASRKKIVDVLNLE
ncbi:MAG: ATP-binding cassette domain-containing protein [Bacilli bacterium]|nr:ATP-binding cassette domain-containing protein [Bacilli bacterium]